MQHAAPVARARIFRFLAGFMGDAPQASACLLLIVVAGATAMPFTLPAVPAVDWPNHLARLHALSAGPDSAMRRSYVPHWAVIPDLGCDLAYAALKDVLSPAAVLRLCFGGSLLVISAAICRIQWVLFRTATYAVAVAPMIAAGLSFSMGYVNYVMSIGVCLVGAALYLDWRSTLSWRRVSVLSAVATICWITHVAGYGVFAFVLAAMIVHSRCAGRPLGMLRGACVYLAIVGPGLLLFSLAEKQQAPMTITYGMQKSRLLIAPWLASQDVTAMAAFPLVGAMAVIVWKTGSLQFSPVLRPAILWLGGLIVLLPWRIGDAIDVDARLMLPFAALGLAGTRVALPARILPHLACITLVMAMLVLRLNMARRDATAVNTEIVAFRKIAAGLAEGSAVMVAQDSGPTGGCAQGWSILPLLHLGSYAVIDRGAYLPTMFAASGMQPLRIVRAPFPASTRPVLPPSVALLSAIEKAGRIASAALDETGDPASAGELRALERNQTTAFLDRWPDSYDALLVLHDGCPRKAVPQHLAILGGDALFTLYKIRHRGRTGWE